MPEARAASPRQRGWRPAAGRALRGAAAWGVVLALAASAVPPGTDPVEFEKAARTVLCDCGCHPQSVWDCACGRAAEMAEEIAALVRQGRSGEEVIQIYVERKGEQVRVAPTARGFNLVAWLGPAALFVLAAGGVGLVLRRWRRSAEGSPARSAPSALDPDDPYLVRLQKDLEKYS